MRSCRRARVGTVMVYRDRASLSQLMQIADALSEHSCHAALNSRTDAHYFQHCPLFHCRFIALKSRTFVVKSRTTFAIKFVRDLNAKSTPMGDCGRGCLGRGGKLQLSLGSSRQELIGIVSQLVLNASTDCDMYERTPGPLSQGSQSLRRASGVSGTSSDFHTFGGVSRQPSRTPRGETRSMRRPLPSTLSAI